MFILSRRILFSVLVAAGFLPVVVLIVFLCFLLDGMAAVSLELIWSMGWLRSAVITI